MKPFWVFITILIIGIALTFGFLALNCSANTIGVSLNSNSVDDDFDFGVYGDYEKEFKSFDFGLEGQLDSGIGYVEPSISFDLGAVDIRLVSSNDVKFNADSYDIQGQLGLDAVVPIQDVNFSVGVFGSGNAGEYIPEKEWEDDGTGNPKLIVNDDLKLPDGFGAGIAVKGEFNVSRFELGLQGLYELFGNKDRLHQLISDVSTGGSLTDNISWTAQARLKSYYSPDVEINNTLLEYSVISGLSYAF